MISLETSVVMATAMLIMLGMISPMVDQYEESVSASMLSKRSLYEMTYSNQLYSTQSISSVSLPICQPIRYLKHAQLVRDLARHPDVEKKSSTEAKRSDHGEKP